MDPRDPNESNKRPLEGSRVDEQRRKSYRPEQQEEDPRSSRSTSASRQQQQHHESGYRSDRSESSSRSARSTGRPDRRSQYSERSFERRPGPQGIDRPDGRHVERPSRFSDRRSDPTEQVERIYRDRRDASLSDRSDISGRSHRTGESSSSYRTGDGSCSYRTGEGSSSYRTGEGSSSYRTGDGSSSYRTGDGSSSYRTGDGSSSYRTGEGGHRTGESSHRPGESSSSSFRPYIPRGRGGPHNTSDRRNIQERFQNLAEKSTVDAAVLNEPSRSRGRGRGARGGRGRRAERPEKSDAELADFVYTRPLENNLPVMKKAISESTIPLTPVPLVANYYPLISRHNWKLYHYHVYFEPEQERTRDRQFLFGQSAREVITRAVNWYLFDGMALYTAQVIPEALLIHPAKGRMGDVVIRIKANPQVIAPTDDINIQVYNTIIRSCLRGMDLKEMGRYFFNVAKKVPFPDVGLDVIPGYKTSLRQHEQQLLLCVEMTNKVSRNETAWDVIRHGRSDREIRNELLGCVVMTKYNDKTYRVDDIKFDESPSKTFEWKGKGTTSLADYYRMQYGKEVKDMGQPIIYSKPSRKDIRRGGLKTIALIPEFCIMTGLTDSQRKNYQLMKILSAQLQLSPTARVRQIEGFYANMRENRIPEKVLVPAGLNLGSELIRLDGHVLPPERIFLRIGEPVELGVPTSRDGLKYDWTTELNSKGMVQTVALENWAVICQQGDQHVVQFIRKLQDVAKRMGFAVNERYLKLEANRKRSDTIRSYMEKIDHVMASLKGRIQLILCVLPGPDETLYGEVKRKCYLEYGIPSQCVVSNKCHAKPGHENKMDGIASKIVVQMNCKLGGVPWKVTVPINGLMVLGFNISNTGRTKSSNHGKSMGALVASLNKEQTKYFSCIVEQESAQNLSTLLEVKLTLALDAYQKANANLLPARIIFYRDGVGEGQLKAVNDTEVGALKEAIETKYQSNGVPKPKFGFIVVNKRLNTKFFKPAERSRTEYENPIPGTVVDDIVTLPERMDFYLMPSKGTGQGTISPVAYNIIHEDNLNLTPAKIQYLTFKLCHLYFNWSSTVSVPAPCQYAHKLAFLANIMNKSNRGQEGISAHESLSSSLYYL